VLRSCAGILGKWAEDDERFPPRGPFFCKDLF
jgi:hypothetical protein